MSAIKTLVREVLTGSRPIKMGHNDRHEYDALKNQYVSPEDKAALSQALLELADDPDLRLRAAAVLLPPLPSRRHQGSSPSFAA